jgi:hypothetical protein
LYLRVRGGNVAGAVVEFRLRRWALVAVLATALSAGPADVALGAQPCLTALAETQLASAVGAAYGTPVGCPRVDADGDTLQITTTGLAMYRQDGLSVFASGDQHWALTDQGLQTWSANWHNGLLPPTSSSPLAVTDQTASLRTHLASIEPMTLLGVDPDLATAVIKQDSTGGMLRIQTASGCQDLAAAVGDHVFLRSDGTSEDLVLVRQHETCAVAPLGAAEND